MIPHERTSPPTFASTISLSGSVSPHRHCWNRNYSRVIFIPACLSACLPACLPLPARNCIFLVLRRGLHLSSSQYDSIVFTLTLLVSISVSVSIPISSCRCFSFSFSFSCLTAQGALSHVAHSVTMDLSVHEMKKIQLESFISFVRCAATSP
jgi:hypothetical protein